MISHSTTMPAQVRNSVLMPVVSATYVVTHHTVRGVVGADTHCHALVCYHLCIYYCANLVQILIELCIKAIIHGTAA